MKIINIILMLLVLLSITYAVDLTPEGNEIDCGDGYLFCDDFEDASINWSGKWQSSQQASYNEVNGTLFLSSIPSVTYRIYWKNHILNASKTWCYEDKKVVDFGGLYSQANPTGYYGGSRIRLGDNEASPFAIVWNNNTINPAEDVNITTRICHIGSGNWEARAWNETGEYTLTYSSGYDALFTSDNIPYYFAWASQTGDIFYIRLWEGDENDDVASPPSAQPELTITYPSNNFYSENSSELIYFNITDFEPNICYLYANDTGSFEVKDFINATGTYNITTNSSEYNNKINGYFKFENNGNLLLDSSQHMNNGSFENSLYNNSKGSNNTGNYSGQFDGANTWAYTDASSGLYSFGDGSDDLPFSIGMWSFMDDSRPFRFIGNKDNTNYEWFFTIDGSGYARFQLHDLSAGATLTTTSTSAYSTSDLENKWSHWIVTYDGSEIDNGVNIYKDGSVIAMTHSTSGTYTAMESDNTILEIGSLNNGTSKADGILDEVFIMNVELTTANITKIYNNGLDAWINTSFSTQEFNNTINTSLIQNLTFDFISNSYQNADYYIMCYDGSNLFSQNQTLTYKTDLTNPVITQNSPIDYEHLNDSFISVNFSTNEYTNCFTNMTEFTETSSDGTLHIWGETLLDNGDFGLNVTCIDLAQNNASEIIYFSKDTILPLIEFYFPASDGSSQVVINESFLTNIELTDSNLYSYQMLVYDINGLLVSNYSLDSLVPPYYSIQEYITPSKLTTNNNYTIVVTAWDSHTKNKIDTEKDYKHKIKDKLITFDMKNKKEKYKQTNVTIEYTGSYDLINTELIEETDRFKFKYTYDLKTNKGKKIKQKYKVKCDNIQVVESEYIGHFICPVSENWIDFQSDVVEDYEILSCGYDCYEIIINTNGEEEILFESIGTLNSNTESVSFQVVEELDKPFDFFIDLESLSGIFFLFILVFLYLGLLAIGFTFKNVGFISFAFFIGIGIGMILFSFHIFFTILFTMINIGMFIGYGKIIK